MLKEQDGSLNVDAIMQEIRQNAAQIERLEVEQSIGDHRKTTDSHGSPEQPRLGPGIELKDSYSLGELLHYRDEQFVVNAWWALLRREPDQDRVNHYLYSLRSGGLKKVEILAQLRYCPEGRKTETKVKGLFMPAVFNKIYRTPVVGYPVRLATALIRLPSLVRTVQTLDSSIAERTAELRGHEHQLKMWYEERTSLLERSIQEQEEQVRVLGRTIQDQIEELSLINGGLARQIKRIEDRKADAESLSELKQAYEVHAQSISELVQVLDRMEFSKAGMETVDRVQTNVEKLIRGQKKLDQQVLDHKRNLVDQHRRLALLLEEARKRLPEPIEKEQIVTMVTEEDHMLDAMYSTFEDEFRGTREDIKDRLRIYLPYIQGAADKAKDESGQRSVLDLGCGRGEWLELLREAGIPAKGIDRNRIMIKECWDRDLEVIESDVIEYLREQKAGSISAITGFHIIEHFPLDLIIAMLDEALRVLRPGGLVVFETPNPANILVGSCTFYTDPTHRNPLPSPLTNFLLEARGFSQTEILELHPYEDSHLLSDNDSPIIDRFNRHFYGARDYAAIGWKA
jgi:O-antigen chain-terminating methyltransferase